ADATPKSTVPATAPTVVVPDLTGQAFVFAKGSLEDAGFAWRVVGPVHGYAVNRVVSQSPAAGTKLKDTGAPTVSVSLARTGYAETGEPEDVSPYIGTAVILASTPFTAQSKPVAQAPTVAKRAEKKPVATKPVAKKPVAKKPAATPTAAKRPPAFT